MARPPDHVAAPQLTVDRKIVGVSRHSDGWLASFRSSRLSGGQSREALGLLPDDTLSHTIAARSD